MWLDETGLGVKDAYRIDCVPDKANLSYDSLYSGSVAAYRRKLPITGLSSGQAVSLDDGRGKASKRGRDKHSRYFTTELAVGEEVTLVRSAATAGGMVAMGDMVAIGDSPALSVESRQSGDYNKALMRDPHNVSLWLEFINAQESLLDWEKGGKRRQAMTNRKISIFEKALLSNPTSVPLLLGYMSLVATCWEPKAVIKRWKEMVFTQPNVPELWLGYIGFCQNNFTEFSVDSVAALYAKCISTLSMISEGTLKSHSPNKDNELWTLVIFAQYCNFLREAGFTERGVASYQALLELNLCAPPTLSDSSLHTQLTQLGQFWASYAARLGEPGARGWMAHPKPLGPLDLGSHKEPTLDDDEDDVAMVTSLSLKEAWIKLEAHRSKEHCKPWVSSDEPLDSERVIPWETLKPCMFRLSTSQLKLECMLRFLSFLGALTPPHHSPTPHLSQRTAHPHQLSSNVVSTFSSLLSDGVCVPLGVSEAPRVCESIAEYVSYLSQTLLFTTPLFHSPLSRTISLVCNQTLSLLSEEHAQTQVALVWISHTLTELGAALQSNAQVKESKKAAQKLVKSLLKLKDHRNNFELWRACALVEHHLGSDPSQMLHTLLSSTLTARLVASLVEIAIGLVPSLVPRQDSTDNTQVALNALLCLSEGKYNKDTPVTPTRLLMIDWSSSQTDPLHIGLCRAYFEYLTRGVAPAIRVLNDLCDTLSPQSELVGTVRCKQVHLLLHSPLAQPKTLRAVLDSALLVAPGNAWLLANKLLIEEQSFSVGHIPTQPAQGAEALLFRFLGELRRSDRMAALSGSSSGAVRRAVGMLDRCAGESPLLWTVYMELRVSLCKCVLLEFPEWVQLLVVYSTTALGCRGLWCECLLQSSRHW